MVHASPEDPLMGGIRLLDQHGHIIQQEEDYWAGQLAEFDYDVLVVGHTHQVFARQLGSSLVINPGSTQFNHSCAILNLPDLTVEFIPLSDHDIAPVWNWGAYRMTLDQ